jgi:hypothetical protein
MPGCLPRYLTHIGAPGLSSRPPSYPPMRQILLPTTPSRSTSARCPNVEVGIRRPKSSGLGPAR